MNKGDARISHAVLGPGHIVRNAQSLRAYPVSILIISAVAEDTVKVAIKK